MSETIKICPFLGMVDDRTTSTSFPSIMNCCYHAKPVEVVEFTHQHDFCLSENCINCPVYTRKDLLPLPNEIRMPQSQYGRVNALNWKTIFLGLLFVAVVVFGITRIFFQNQIIPTAKIAPTLTSNAKLTAIAPGYGGKVTQTLSASTLTSNSVIESSLALTQGANILAETTLTPAITANQTASPISALTPTYTLTPTLTLTPTSTSIPTATQPTVTRDLDTPIGTNPKLVIHQIQSGENLSTYAANFKTTAEAILRINYSLPVPLRTDNLIVIPVEFSTVAQLPYFQPYRVSTEGITVEKMARELGTDLNDFIYYNNFYSGEELRLGDWILVPRLESAE